MDLLQRTESTVTEVTYTLQHPTEGVIHYKEWRDERGKVIDSVTRSKNGFEINDPVLVEQIWQFVDEHESK